VDTAQEQQEPGKEIPTGRPAEVGRGWIGHCECAKGFQGKSSVQVPYCTRGQKQASEQMQWTRVTDHLQ
jgi:hypothetical protein